MLTRKSNDRVRMWVSPAFKRKLKAQASEEGFNLIDYTDKIAQEIKQDVFKKNELPKFNFKI